MNIVLILKHESFKERHWMVLWDEMFLSIPQKPEVKGISLKKLLDDRLLSFSSLIFKIATVIFFLYLT